MSSDTYYMRQALAYSKRCLGQTFPNPAVGCVLVDRQTQKIVSSGWTDISGRPHAEQMALSQLPDAVTEFDAYVTLEPCCHYGKTPPCIELLIARGLKKLVYAIKDPFPKVSGQSAEYAKQHGIEVVEHVLAYEARWMNRGFLSTQVRGRPWVTAKMATSLDGKIALSNGKSQWITNQKSRDYVHILRSQYDAIVTSIRTVTEDDPLLNCRLSGLEEKSPIRIVIDKNADLSLESQLANTAKTIPTWLLVSDMAEKEKIHKIQEIGIKTLCIDLNNKGQFSWNSLLEKLAENGLTRIFIEVGSSMLTSLLQDNVIDEMWHFQAPKIIGDDGLNIIGDLNIEKIEEIYTLSKRETLTFDEDIANHYINLKSISCLQA